MSIGASLAINHIFYARQFQGRKKNLSREFHEFLRIGEIRGKKF
jgi:hypothetical protein